ncbi:MAG TPA: aspartate aminotransferase family protein [Smithellaceae bacterium]|nr:aspartate aminotransferase family protein [Smithellaceae bacterium]HOM70190.1 aspartate aminotransferase family protein [Smithellaceae bacterium]HOS08402.1 aspartate aminotransferase family protein [Smithellaceae bacterium]HPD49013.1 aspartate aminotransferase family protein [Smithellaceae bacterium]HPL49321.1 aspartate aminotransferase family protein [Smithellaceae bacterium]
MKHVGFDAKDKIIRRFAEYVNPGKVETFQAYDMQFVFGRREGPYVWDAQTGKRLINCHCNGGVFNLGHRNPKIVQALRESLDELDIGNHHLISEQRGLLAEKLSLLMPGDIDCTVFGVGGGEAIDLAIKLARGYTGKFKIISARGGYHGHTGFALATGDEQYRAPFGANLPGFVQIPFNDIDAFGIALDNKTAAVIFETIPATLGMPLPDPDYYKKVAEICRRIGALLIIDEVQTGLGRTGKLWGIQNYDTVPDIIVIGKGLSGGIYPMSATCFRRQYMDFFRQNPFIHISTFGGAEVGCPVAAAVLEESSKPEFLRNVNNLATIFAEAFTELKKKHPRILVGLRQMGLMMGIEMVKENCGPFLTKSCYDHGILAIYANNDKRVCQLLPPLIIDRQIAGEIISGVDAALKDTADFLGLK